MCKNINEGSILVNVQDMTGKSSFVVNKDESNGAGIVELSGI